MNLQKVFQTKKTLKDWSFMTDVDYRLFVYENNVEKEHISGAIGLHRILNAWIEDSMYHDEGYSLADQAVSIEGIYEGPKTDNFDDGETIITSHVRQLITNRNGELFAITQNSCYRLGKSIDKIRLSRLESIRN